MSRDRFAQPAPARNRPSRFTPVELKKFGVELLGGGLDILMRCSSCGSTWSPELTGGGNLPRGYWRCPRGCNTLSRELFPSGIEV